MGKISAIALLVLPFTSASVTKIAGSYEPGSIMTDQTAMDLDQNAMMYHLLLSSDSGYETAREIYDNGAYSDAYAILKLSGANIPAAGISKGTKISGLTEGGNIEGQAYADMSPGSTTLSFKYPIFDMQPPNHVGCIVGNLPTSWHTTGGCLQESGVVNIESVGTVNYTYSIENDNKNGRSFRAWSTQADSMMGMCAGGCPYSEFSKFKKYYGQAAYADEWITAALEKRSTNFPGLGGADFSTYGYDGRTQAIMKGTAYMTNPMFVLRQLEFALDNCKSSKKEQAVKAWDEGVAFYTGSMALGEPGLFMYALAEKRCKNFKTCGRQANQLEGTSYINLEMFDIFDLGQYHLERNDCEPIRDLVDRAVALMAIPQIQGTLRYAYKVGKDVDTSEKAKAEGAVFAASVLPRVHACNEADAKTIYDNMKVEASSTDFQAVLKAFENNYGCMGIAAWEVGAIYDTAANNGDGGYLYGEAETLEATASTTTEPSTSGKNTLAIGLGVGLGAAALIIVALFMMMRGKKNDKQEPAKFVNEGADPV